MERFNPIRSANGYLEDIACGRIQLHFPITCQDDFRHPFGGSNVDSLYIGPIDCFEPLVRLDFFKHFREGDARCFSRSPFFRWLNPGPLFLDLQQKSG